MNSIFAFLSNACSAVGQLLGFAKQRDAEKNTPAMEAAAAAEDEQKQKDAASKAVAGQNLKIIRDELCE